MAKVAVWCRHVGDNIIGIGSQIPWSVPSDVQKFVRIITGQDVVMGAQDLSEPSGARFAGGQNLYCQLESRSGTL